jgi:hypothetical protein
MGKVVQPLQSVNYHDSRAHGHDMLGFGWFGSVGFSGTSWFGSWYAAGAKLVCIIWLQVGCL